jgi:hypothetical protein
MLGLISFSTTFDGTSKIAYGKKKLMTRVSSMSDLRALDVSSTHTVKAMLYCDPVNANSVFMPATLALAMLLLSKKARRYRSASTGTSLKSTLRRILFVSFGSKTCSCCLVVRFHSAVRCEKAVGRD